MTKVTILGTGNMARAIATSLLAGGNSVTLYSRTPDNKSAVAQELAPLARKGATVKVEKMSSPIADPVIISTVWYTAALDLFASYGGQLESKILVDVCNPVNQTYDDLVTPPGSSAVEEFVRIVPRTTRVLKAFNTTFAVLISQGQVGGQPLDILIAGDDQAAKASFSQLLQDGGLHPLDAGPLRRARQLESMALLLIGMQSTQAKPWQNGFQLLS